MSIFSCSFFLFLSFYFFIFIKADTSCLIKGFINLAEENFNRSRLVRKYYLCPDPYLPPEFTDCCLDRDQCCPPSRSLIFETIHNHLVIVTVLLACFIFFLLLLICCFVPSCPLYNSCRNRYNQDETGCADKMNETAFTDMPGEKNPANNEFLVSGQYGDKVVTIRPKEEDL